MAIERANRIVALCYDQAKAEHGHQWIPLKFYADLPMGKWCRIVYRSSFLDPVTRPTIRFETPTQTIEMLMPAPLWGRAWWVGFVPVGTLRVWLSVGHSRERHTFAIEGFSRVRLANVIGTALRRDPLRAAAAIGQFCIGRVNFAKTVLRYALDGTSLSRYHRWRTSRERQIDSADLEQLDTRAGPRFDIVLRLEGGSAPALVARTLSSIRAQSYGDWQLTFAAESSKECYRMAEAFGISSRTRYIPQSIRVAPATSSFQSDWTIALEPGDILAPYALAAVAREALCHPEVRVIYADEDEIDEFGRYCRPKLKPDWSPIFQRTARYLGHAIWFHAAVFSEAPRTSAQNLMAWSAGDACSTLLERLPVRHLRRVLVTVPRSRSSGGADMIDSSAAGRPATKHSAGEPEVSIIIPSKDKADLLSNCLRSLLATRGPHFEIIVVDNGSVEPETEELYAQIQNRTDIRILRDPSPFNFARLCNLGARTARGSALLFLNNDTEVLHPAWLERMIHWSSQPDVGAVGAKLAYPSMRIQHAGLVLGLFGLVAHSDLGVGTRRGGYLGRLLYTREVSAVTGACLAVSRSKFAAVSGFDETAFPVDLNDIDLCLRLSQRGWKALMVNDALLIHYESASRGRTRHPEIKYRREIANFRARWNCILHDDPYFHPALSLSSFNIRLG